MAWRLLRSDSLGSSQAYHLLQAANMQSAGQVHPQLQGRLAASATVQQARLHMRARGVSHKVLRPRTCVHVAATTADYSCRVRGDSGRVQLFIADVSQWPTWYPGTKRAVRLGLQDEPVRAGSQFEVYQEKWGLKIAMKYEVLEYEPSKRLVLSGLSEYHTQLDQFAFMPDRHDSKHTCVRYISNLKLREWRSALQPVIGKMMAKVPEEALQQLQRTLGSSASPLQTRAFEAQYQAAVRASRTKQRSPSGTTTTSGSSRRSRGASERGGPGKAWNFRGLFSWGSSMESSMDSASEASSPYGTVSSSSNGQMDVLDPNGYYTLLGLTASAQVTQEEIKVAYRRLAMQWHPDRQTGKDERTRVAAANNFAKLLKAYEVLGDEEQRRLYDRGDLVEATLSL